MEATAGAWLMQIVLLGSIATEHSTAAQRCKRMRRRLGHTLQHTHTVQAAHSLHSACIIALWPLA